MVASETKILYATLIHFPSAKRMIFHGVLEGVYDRCLKWAYEEAWNDNNPMQHMPEFRTEIVSSASYPVDRENVCFIYFIWKTLMEMVLKAGLPLPAALKILPAIVVKWNRCKGRIDEMTRHLDDMIFKFRRGSAKQLLVMRELKKLVLSVYFTKKHCFPKFKAC